MFFFSSDASFTPAALILEEQKIECHYYCTRSVIYIENEKDKKY